MSLQGNFNFTDIPIPTKLTKYKFYNCFSHPLLISVFYILFSCKEKEQNKGLDHFNDKSTQAKFLNDSKRPPQYITSVKIPVAVTFAGETIPLKRPDVREALEAELMVNTFRHSRTLAIIKNVERWRRLVVDILQKEDVPIDFLYVAVVESEFDNNALSPTGAAGMWQLMEATAKEYNLVVDEDADMRRDPKLSTQVAARFLKKAYSELQNWTLSAAAYNVGIQGLKNRLNIQKVNNFYDLHLNPETARYIYRIIAFKLILENPESYGYFVPNEEKYAPYKFDVLKVNKDIDNLVEFAKTNRTTYKQLRLLNPWFNNTEDFRLNVSKKEIYEIRIPADGK